VNICEIKRIYIRICTRREAWFFFYLFSLFVRLFFLFMYARTNRKGKKRASEERFFLSCLMYNEKKTKVALSPYLNFVFFPCWKYHASTFKHVNFISVKKTFNTRCARLKCKMQFIRQTIVNKDKHKTNIYTFRKTRSFVLLLS
jgi:hypothetical protein